FSRQYQNTLLRSLECVNKKIIDIFLQLGIEVKPTDPQGKILIHKVITDGNLESLQYLKELGVDFAFKDGFGNSMLHRLIHNKTARTTPELFRFMCQQPAIDINERNSCGQNIFTVLPWWSPVSTEVYSVLCEARANPNITDDNG